MISIFKYTPVVWAIFVQSSFSRVKYQMKPPWCVPLDRDDAQFTVVGLCRKLKKAVARGEERQEEMMVRKKLRDTWVTRMGRSPRSWRDNEIWLLKQEFSMSIRWQCKVIGWGIIHQHIDWVYGFYFQIKNHPRFFSDKCLYATVNFRNCSILNEKILW